MKRNRPRKSQVRIKRELLKEEIFDCLRKNIEQFIPEPTKAKRLKKKAKVKIRKIEGKLRIADYKQYLRSERWKQIKADYFSRFGKKCVICGSERQIGLHHMTYRNLGNEKDEDLVALCWKHHYDYHRKHGKADYHKSQEFVIEEQEIKEMNDLKKRIH